MFRIKIGSSDFWSRLNTGWVCEILDTLTIGDVLWYKVTANTPEHLNRSYTGYIRGDFLTVMTNEEIASWLADPSQHYAGSTSQTVQPVQTSQTPRISTPIPVSSNKYAVTTQGGVNLRATQGGASLTALPADTVVFILEEPDSAAEDPWYKVTFGEYTGYIAVRFLRIISSPEAEAGTSSTPTAATLNPTRIHQDTASGDQPSQNTRRSILLQLDKNMSPQLLHCTGVYFRLLLGLCQRS